MNIIDENYIKISMMILLSIVILSLYPVENLPSVPGTDKTHHFIAYATLAFPVSYARSKSWILLMPFFLLCSGLIELIQPFVNRYGEWLDMLANASGLALGSVLGIFTKIIINKLIR